MMDVLGKEALRMDSPNEIFPAEDRCEVCGGKLGDEVVIQEFADGSLARLCAECAAGAALDERYEAREKLPAPPPDQSSGELTEESPEGASAESSEDAPERSSEESSGVIWPEEPAEMAAARAAEMDPLERTRELLMPVTDLITLQSDMQTALQRLAASLERFATETLVESQDKTALESRLQMLERELEKTRARLEETEFLLVSTMETAPGALAGITAEVDAAPEAEPGAPEAVATDIAAETEAEAVLADTPDHTAEITTGAESPSAEEDLWTSVAATQAEEPPEAEATAPEPPPAYSAVAEPVPPPSDQQAHGTGFRIDEVQAAQRYYNESPFTSRVRDVSQSLGKPKANLTRIPGAEPRAVVTIAWDIVWYQYLVDLRRDLPSTHERVVLHREGMDLDELAYYFREPNALVNDDGRLDASELEVRLLSDPSALITEMTADEMQALEDATEEIWDQRVAPEFKWDD
jgi:hypothetical protein